MEIVKWELTVCDKCRNLSLCFQQETRHIFEVVVCINNPSCYHCVNTCECITCVLASICFASQKQPRHRATALFQS